MAEQARCDKAPDLGKNYRTCQQYAADQREL